MSDTPRTDAFVDACNSRSSVGYKEALELARQFERELTEAKAQRGTLAFSSHEGGWTPLGEIIVGLEREIAKLKLFAPTEVAPLIELLREIRHAADLGYHGGKNTREHCKDCELANRIDAAVSPLAPSTAPGGAALPISDEHPPQHCSLPTKEK